MAKPIAELDVTFTPSSGKHKDVPIKMTYKRFKDGWARVWTPNSSVDLKLQGGVIHFKPDDAGEQVYLDSYDGSTHEYNVKYPH